MKRFICILALGFTHLAFASTALAQSRNPERFVLGTPVVKPLPNEFRMIQPKAPDSKKPKTGMVHTPHLTPMFLVGLLLTGCSEITEDVKPLPPEYRVLATLLASEAKTSPKEFEDKRGLNELIKEGHSGVLDLRRIKSTDTELNYIAGLGDSAFTEGVRRMERLIALPKPKSDGGIFFESFLHGYFGNYLGGVALGLEEGNKRVAIADEVLAFFEASEKAKTAALLLPRVAEKYSAPMAPEKKQIQISFQENWGGSLSHDWLQLYNNGPEIEDCTILVEIKGQGGKIRKNVHFVPKWTTKTWIYCRYSGGMDLNGKMVGCETVIDVDSIDVTVFSPNYSNKGTYAYTGMEKDNWIEQLCDKKKFSGGYRPFKAGVFWDDEPAAYFTLEEGTGWLPKCEALVTFKNGGDSLARVWKFDSWTLNEKKLFLFPKGFDPKTIDILITFPNTTAQIKRTLNVNTAEIKRVK